MSIRTATTDDVPRLVELGAALHAESPRWSRIPFSRARAAETLTALILSADGVVYVAERDGQIIGGIAACIQQHWACEARVAHELSFFIEPARRGGFDACRLICAMRAWAEMRGAVWLVAGTSTGVDPELTARLYERLGFERTSIGLEAHYGS